MDQAILSTVSALAGTVIGGMTSFATTWLNTTAQARAARLAAERTKREELYGRFIDQLAVLYADALQQEAVNYDKLSAVYALRGRISLLASAPVFAAAEHAVKFVVDLNIGARRTDQEMRRLMDEKSYDVLTAFASAARREIDNLR